MAFTYTGSLASIGKGYKPSPEKWEEWRKAAVEKGFIGDSVGSTGETKELPSSSAGIEEEKEKLRKTGEGFAIISKGGKEFMMPHLSRKDQEQLEKLGFEVYSEGSTTAKRTAKEKMQEERGKQLAGKLTTEYGVPTELPGRKELDIQRISGEETPLIGAPITPVQLALTNYFKTTGAEEYLSEELNAFLGTPEGRREIMLSEIQAEEFKKAYESLSELGVIVESIGLTKIPFNIGEMVEKFTKTPSEDVRALRERIAELDSRASSMTDSSSQGELGDPTAVLKTLSDMDIQIAKIEAQMKALIIFSSTLRSDPEEINNIEEEILSARTTIAEAQQRAAEGALITPTEESLFFKLMKLKNEGK